MNKYISLLLLIFSSPAFGETYLCVAEEGAGVTHFPTTGRINAEIFNVTSKKYILTNESGDRVRTSSTDTQGTIPHTIVEKTLVGSSTPGYVVEGIDPFTGKQIRFTIREKAIKGKFGIDR